MPNDFWTVYRMAGQQMRLTATDLIARVTEMSGRKQSERRELGYLISAWMLQALAAKYLLKGLSVRNVGRFIKSHDLLELLEALDCDTQAEIAEHGAQQDISVREFLDKHRNGFVDWRYPFEEMRSVPEPIEFDSLLAALSEVCESGQPEDGAQPPASDVKPAELTILHHIILACRHEYPNSVELSILHDQLADRDEDTILYHVGLLETLRFVEVSEQETGEIQGVEPAPHSVRLSDWVAASADRLASQQSATD